MNIPSINDKYCCIVNYDKQYLANIISAYLNEPLKYLPMFIFPKVSSFDENKIEFDEYTLGREKAKQFSIQVSNNLLKMDGCEYLIVAGLTKEQKSYLDFLGKYNVLEIDDENEATTYLPHLNSNNKHEISICKTQLLSSLQMFSNTSFIPNVTNAEVELSPWFPKGEGIVIIEKSSTSESIIALNYAIAIQAKVVFVEELEIQEKLELTDYLFDWKKDKRNPNEKALTNLKAFIYKRIGGIDFKEFEFVTFFTKGIPYTILTQNDIPSSYVDLSNKCDFFIFSNLIYSNFGNVGSALIFSPSEFEKEETEELISFFERKEFFVKDLVEKNATVNNLDVCLRILPYDIVHLCSHGGEVDGFGLMKEFTDREGDQHLIEYDEVLSFFFSGIDKDVKIEAKQIWRKFNGDVWGSEPFNNKGYPRYVFVDMIQAARHDSKSYEGAYKRVIKDSAHIKCYKFNYQALFNTLCDMHTTPIVFNNTCYSIHEIKNSFINSGSRGYIGTLWDVENHIAIKFAEEFYSNLIGSFIIDAFQNANSICKGTFDDNIYLYYGLHFSRFQGNNPNHRDVLSKHLLTSFYNWKNYSEKSSDKNLQKESDRLKDYAFNELYYSFNAETKEILNF